MDKADHQVGVGWTGRPQNQVPEGCSLQSPDFYPPPPPTHRAKVSTCRLIDNTEL